MKDTSGVIFSTWFNFTNTMEKMEKNADVR